jgi:uncharacterized protein YraI
VQYMSEQSSSNNQNSPRGLIIAIIILAFVVIAAAAFLIYLFLGGGAPSQDTQLPTALPGPEVGVPTPVPDSPTATATTNINVRSGPGLNYPIFGVAPNGTTFEVSGISEDSGWWQVKLPTTIAPDGRGWVSADYVTTSNTENVPVVPTPSLPPEVIAPTPAPNIPTATTLDTVNVRGGPGNQYPSYGKATTGTTFAVSGVSPDGGWWQVLIPTDITPDGKGWINAGYVETSNTENVPVVQPPPAP